MFLLTLVCELVRVKHSFHMANARNITKETSNFLTLESIRVNEVDALYLHDCNSCSESTLLISDSSNAYNEQQFRFYTLTSPLTCTL